MAIFRRGPPNGASNAREVWNKSRFSTYILLYLGTDARESHSYYGRRIGNFWIVSVWRPWVTSNYFQGHDIIQRQITQKRYKIEPYLQCGPIESRKPYMIYRTAPFSMTLKDACPRFQDHAIFDAGYLRLHDFNGILIGTYTHPTQQCHFEWPWVILSDLAKY